MCSGSKNVQKAIDFKTKFAPKFSGYTIGYLRNKSGGGSGLSSSTPSKDGASAPANENTKHEYQSISDDGDKQVGIKKFAPPPPSELMNSQISPMTILYCYTVKIWKQNIQKLKSSENLTSCSIFTNGLVFRFTVLGCFSLVWNPDFLSRFLEPLEIW